MLYIKHNKEEEYWQVINYKKNKKEYIIKTFIGEDLRQQAINMLKKMLKK
jgi:hypothetical protein